MLAGYNHTSQLHKGFSYRVLDDDGYLIPSTIFEQVSKELALNMYSTMVALQTMDTIFYEAQRQGRLSFYLTSTGEEAINIASAAALTLDDIVLPQYREPGVLLCGFTLKNLQINCSEIRLIMGKGRQMPIHMVPISLIITVSSSHLPQAAGVASLKMDKKEACVVFILAMVAPVRTKSPVMKPCHFPCRNNGWAISTPGQAYGIRSIRVDGNDVLQSTVLFAFARQMAIKEQKPILVEAMTYRVSHHSTSDDSTKYRCVKEIEQWRTEKSPITRFRKWIQRNGWWADQNELELRGNIRNRYWKQFKLQRRLRNLH
ncbi:hypothetical protein HAX54_018521 [Datura stramonium]|uniref:Dehydrogenase E1 component domain-containing protein n=1 Tax=Datura stramonium TaxID=4076 RepID=A0ABS8UN85_DATST|nr:hypothetical protein [Datura stramonium]